jgi:Peptidase family M1 domain
VAWLLAALSAHAESDYTHLMKLAVTFLGLLLALAPASTPAAERPAREIYDTLNALRVDPASTYHVTATNRIEIIRSDVRLSFEDGAFAFLSAFDGRLTGIVFSGRGHALAVPRGPVEKQQMARFLGAPILDQDFTSVCLRFTDGTAGELLRQFEKARLSPETDSAFASLWDKFLVSTNPSQSLRILFDFLSRNPRPYFYAWIEGVSSGPFDFVLDELRDEPLLLGQVRRSFGRAFYDVWASYKIPGVSAPEVPFRAIRYDIDTTILPNISLEAKAELRIRAETSGERMLVLQLARTLNIDEVTDDRGQPLAHFQNEGLSLRERGTRGNNYLYVVLPAPAEKGAEFTLRFRYRGNIIEDAGNGVLFVGARETWYPHLGDAADFAHYDLTMRWPRRLRLVATGAKVDEREEGDFRVAHWRTERPTSIAGFNLGDYSAAALSSGTRSIEIFANHQLEQALNNRLNAPSADILPRPPTPFGPEGRSGAALMQIIPLAPSPADALKQLGREIDSSIRFYETLSGPFPFQKLSVSQIPGSFGQGWPGLLYLSTYSFLPPAAQQRAGLSESSQALFTELVPFHEVAHQWWGNVVGWESYRDQWIDEALANYLALLFADNQNNDNHSLRVWLTRYRRQLLAKRPEEDQSPSEIGAIELGSRLTSSKSPEGFEAVIYSKGSWVMHMLREMLRQPGVPNPDARFIALLHTLQTKYAYRALSTADLQREVEAVMTSAMDLEGGRSLDWFFEQWVRGTGIPRYRVEFTAQQNDKGYLVRGKLFQSGVPRSFIAPVPLYANTGTGPLILLGRVITDGAETSFHFVTKTPPRKIVIDPQMTLLCVSE